jgi:glutathione S-transferase
MRLRIQKRATDSAPARRGGGSLGTRTSGFEVTSDTTARIISRLEAVATTPVLYHIEVSHYNEKVRWALDYKGIPHRRKAPMPMMHMAWATAMTRGKGMTFPILRINGDVIHDSTRIIETLEREYPEPPLYPDDPDDRRRALGLEEFFDEELAPHIRRAAFAVATRDPETFAWVAAPRAGRTQHTAFKGAARVIGPLVRARYGIDGDTAREGWAKTKAAFDRLESEIGPSGYLVADRFTVADLTAAALFFPLVRPPESEHLTPGSLPEGFERMRAEVAGRPGWSWVLDMYRRHRGTSSAIAA